MGSFSDKGKRILHKEKSHIDRTFIAGEDIQVGDELYLSDVDTVSKRAGNATEKPIGYARQGALADEKLLVETNFIAIGFASSSAAIVAGAILLQVGTYDANGLPLVVTASTTGDLSSLIALQSAVGAGESIEVGYLSQSYVVPA